jgi:hypothetical protein
MIKLIIAASLSFILASCAFHSGASGFYGSPFIVVEPADED